VFDIDMQHCPNCGAGELKIIAAILERPVIQKILHHLGLDPQPPPKGPARQPLSRGRTSLPEPRPPSKTHRHTLHCHTAAGWRCAPCRREMPHNRVNPEIKAKTAVCERSQTYRLDGHASRDAQLRVLEPSADPACSLCWALPMAFEISMP
jgi:hypothetical protein